MPIFKVKDKNRCPEIMHMCSPGGIVLMEDHCRLPRGHEGFHRGERGTVWDNYQKRREEIERSWERPDKRLIFLAK